MRAVTVPRAFAFAALVLLPVSGEAASLRAEYSLSLAGFTLGKAVVSTTIDGSRYKLDGDLKLTGIAAVMGGKGHAAAEGALGPGKPVSTSFAVTGRSGSEQRRLQLSLADGNVSAIDIVPPFEPKADRVPLAESHKRAVTDPLSSVLMPVAGAGNPLDPANCNRTIPVFDGAARFDIVLTYSGTRRFKKPGYDGTVLVCDVRYVPIAGHRAMRPATLFMRDNRDMSVWLAPMPGTRVLMPIRIAIMTMYGMSLIEAESWTADGVVAPAKAASARP